MATKLDFEQAIQLVTDDSNEAFRVEGVGGTIVTEAYDYILLSYLTMGNGSGQVGTVTYKLGGSSGTTVATLTLVYDSSNRLATITKS